MDKVKLSEIANIRMGQSPEGSTCNETGDGVPLLNGPTEFTSFYPIPRQYTTDPKRFSEAGDILFCVRGSTTGRMNWSDQHYAIGRGLAALSHKKGKELNHFLRYLIQYNLDSLLNSTSGSTFPNLTNDMLASFEIIVPDLPAQQKIAAVLSTLDAKIELNRRINAELESMAKTLYDYWFVQFDFPNEKGKPYKSAGGKMVWNEELKREIPFEWTAQKVKELAETSSGGTPLSTKIEYYENGTIPWINSGELNYPFIVSSSSFITEAGLNNSSAKMFPVNTVLIALYGATAGKVSLLKIEACTNQAVCALLPKSPIYTDFLKYGFGNLYDYLVALSSGSARDNLSQEIIRNIAFAMPPDDSLLQKFNEIVNPLLERIATNLRESQTLTELRDWLLPMLMNGQVNV